MIKVKKIFILGVLYSLLPLSIIGCSVNSPNKEDTQNPDFQDNIRTRLQKELNSIYSSAKDKFLSFATVNKFIPETIRNDKDKFKNYVLDFKFFESVDTSKKLDVLVKLQTKEDFDEIIIKRFKQLNNSQDLKINDTEIREEFQRIYLKNQDVYEFLKFNDIYIYDDGSLGFYYYFVVPFEYDNNIQLNIIKPERYIDEVNLPPTNSTWAVFALPKNKTITVKMLKPQDTNIDSASSWEFKNKLISWYNDEFKNYFK